MRNAALTFFCFVAIGYAASAQRFTLLPQVGFENSKTRISYNDLRSISPLGTKFSPQANLRLNYSSRQGHGLFLGVSSTRSLVSFSFSDPENALNSFSARSGNMQFQLEGGYQFNSKPIMLSGSKHASTKKQSPAKTEKKSCSSSSRSCCSKSYSSHCGSGNTSKAKHPSLNRNKNTWVRIQPSVGMGFIPGVKTNVTSKTQGGQTIYQYNAGNFNTAFIAGAGFEFGKGRTRQFTVSINYFKGLGNLDENTISSGTAAKSVTTVLESAASGWNVKLGIPFTLAIKKPAVKKTEHRSPCGQYRMPYRCGGH